MSVPLNEPATQHDLFDFYRHLSVDELQQVRGEFVDQALKNKKEFSGFDSSIDLNWHKRDFISYLIAQALVDGEIPNDKNGFNKFFQLANGVRDAQTFCRQVMFHTYNLSLISQKSEIFDEVIGAAEKLIKASKFELPIYLMSSGSIHSMLIKERLEGFIKDVTMRLHGKHSFFVPGYVERHKVLTEYLTGNERAFENDAQETKPRKVKPR